MADFVSALANAAKTGLCNYLGDVDKARSWLDSNLGFAPGGSPAAFARRLGCNRPGPDEPPPQFTGGQCPGVRYRWEMDYESRYNPPGCAFWDASSTGSLANSNLRIYGPVTGIRLGSPFDSCGLGMHRYVEADFFDEFGNPVTSRLNFSDLRIVSIQDLRFIRVDGLPDECGDPPPPPPPPFPETGDTYNISFSYENFEGDVVNVDGSIRIFAPVIAPVTVFAPVVYAPIRVDLPDITLNGQIVIAPELAFSFSPTVNIDVGSPEGTPIPVPPGTNPDTEEDDEDKPIIGAYVYSNFDGPIDATELTGGDGPGLFVPRIGVLHFRVRTKGGLGWLYGGDVRMTAEYFPVPGNTVAVGARVTEGRNVTSSVVLVRDTPIPGG